MNVIAASDVTSGLTSNVIDTTPFSTAANIAATNAPTSPIHSGCPAETNRAMTTVVNETVAASDRSMRPPTRPMKNAAATMPSTAAAWTMFRKLATLRKYGDRIESTMISTSRAT